MPVRPLYICKIEEVGSDLSSGCDNFTHDQIKGMVGWLDGFGKKMLKQHFADEVFPIYDKPLHYNIKSMNSAMHYYKYS